MKVGMFYSDSPYASWSQSQGFGDVLRRMGCEVVEVPIPPGNKFTRKVVDRVNVSRQALESCDVIIVSGPEHVKAWIRQFYPYWRELKVPKVAWYHESFIREDYKLDFAEYEFWYDHHFFPDSDDAERFGGTQLTLGIDTGMFNCYGEARRDVDCAFIGLMYPKRQRFHEELKPLLNGIDLQVRAGTIMVQDFDGINGRKSAELLAETYRRIKVFVAFPSVSNVLVAKLLEAPACGCALIAPKNPKVPTVAKFEYETADECASMIRRALKHPTCNKSGVESERMETKLEKIFAKVGLTECVS